VFYFSLKCDQNLSSADLKARQRLTSEMPQTAINSTGSPQACLRSGELKSR
jgi:hypothetical protein